MSLEDNNVPKVDISKMEKLSQKIMSYELERYQAGHSPKNDMSQTLVLFRKYLHDKAQQAMGMANAQGSEATKFQPQLRRSLLPQPSDASLLSQPTLLDKGLLPIARQSSPMASNTSSFKAQLTIFYSGAVNVYDNVPADKAQAIMLLAGESSLLDPIRPTTPTSGVPPRCTNFPPVTKMQIDLPIARKVSLRRFLEGRRDRISTRSPYSCGTLKPGGDRAATDYS